VGGVSSCACRAPFWALFRPAKWTGPSIRVRAHPLGENTGVAHYQPRHSSGEVAGTGRGPRRSRVRVVGAAVAGAVIVAAAVVVPLMVSGGGGPTTTSQAAAPTTTGKSPASTGTSATSNGSTGTHVSTRGAGSPGPTTTETTRPVTTTTRPRVNPAASTSAAVNTAAPSGFGLLITKLWVDANPGGVPMSVADVASTLPGSVFYADQPAIGTYWAISRFVPSAQAEARAGTAAGNALLAQFGTTAIFVKVPGGPWAYLGEFTTTACGQAVPGPVLTSWGMCS
jgi:hypothetical protein